MQLSGAASGIGRAIAQEFSKAGATVIAIDINLDGCLETIKDIKGIDGHFELM